MIKATALVIALLCMASAAFATQTVNYGWENGGTALGASISPNNNGVFSNSTAQVHSGLKALCITAGGTTTTASYNYLGWVKNLTAGDVVTASFYVYDTTSSGSPSGRIWGHYNDSATDVTTYSGSASGNSTYSGATPWTQLSYSWTMPTGHPASFGLEIECRMYTAAIGNTIYVDDMQITAPDTASFVFPAGVPEPSAILALVTGLVGLLGSVSRMRRS